MSGRNFATRMSCFSLISAIETDMRVIIVNELPEDYEATLPADVVKNAKERYYEHNKESFFQENNLIDLLEFIDFYDLSKILSKIKKSQKTFTSEEIEKLIADLENLSKCRNRVCHSRPLEPNDFNTLLDFTSELIKVGKAIQWKNINIALSNLDNPSFALSLEIPAYWKVTSKTVSNNLPLPEFDDTGFMGRDKDRNAINKLLTSNTKVISIVGEGGVGKTALAQRCLYDILELCESSTHEESMFDIIVWVSLKTNRLTANGASQIKNSINSSSGLFQDISKTLAGKSTESMKNDLEEIREYMEEFKILLCIDNLETISANEVREFLADIPNSSKILITTRIGLGEIEYRYKLDKLDDKPSIELMRNMSKLLNLEKIYKKNNDALNQLCKNLFNNPLLIKWYVLAVAAGFGNAELINKRSENFKDALCFCFENLYDRLSDNERKAISVIACLRKPVSVVELRFFLSDVPEIEIEEALHQLHNSSMLISTDDKSSEGGHVYTLTGVAEEYINSVRPISNETYNEVKAKRKELQSIIASENILRNHYNYDLNVISWTTKDEKICSIYLKKALSAHRNGDKELAEQNIKKAKSLMPGFSECYRIHSYLLKDTSPFLAEVELEKAIDIAPRSVISRYAYSQFLINEEEFDRANDQISEALKIDPDDIALQTCKAWVLTLNGEYNEASTIYEKILPEQYKRLLKFRISTHDQAASCYRRMAEQNIRDSDHQSATRNLKRAVEILEYAINNNDYDHGTFYRLYDLLKVSETIHIKFNDRSITDDILHFIEANLKSVNVKSTIQLKQDLSEYKNNCSKAFLDKVVMLLDELSPQNANSNGERINGTIDKVITSERGLSYGFILAIDQIRYFFHRSEINPPSFLSAVDENVNVSFIAGHNERGVCAFDVRER